MLSHCYAGRPRKIKNKPGFPGNKKVKAEADALVTPRPDVPDKTMPDEARRSQTKKLLFLSDFLDQTFPGIFGDRLCQTAPDFFVRVLN